MSAAQGAGEAPSRASDPDHDEHERLSFDAPDTPPRTSLQPDAPERRVGEVFAGRYRLERLLGVGGMGTVWRARSLLLETDVAVKVVPRDAASPQACERLLREARAAASLTHPSIVRVFDFGMTEGGEPFLVMELLEGRSLGDWLEERGRIPATMAVRILLPVIGALAAAHARGVVHRDIKPDNIVIVPGEGDVMVPKLVDFGIVKLQTTEARTTLTQRGMLIGSPGYMSPEQARGLADIDAQTDVWSLCVVLYELITGMRPFEGPNHGAVIFAIYADEPRPSTDHVAGDPELWQILRRGLAKRPGERWPGAKALGRELAAWAAERGVTTDAAGVSIAEQWLGKNSTPPTSLASRTDEPVVAPAGRRSRAEIDTAATPVQLAGPAAAPGAQALAPDSGAFDTRTPRRTPGFMLGAALGMLVVFVGVVALTRSSPRVQSKPASPSAEATAPAPVVVESSAVPPPVPSPAASASASSAAIAASAPPAAASAPASAPASSPPGAPASAPPKRGAWPPGQRPVKRPSSLPSADF